jgi:hypothetical protein
MSGIKYHRLVSGLSIEQLAKQCNISKPTLRTMEGQEEPYGISGAYYIRVAEALKVTPDELIKSDFPDDSVPIRAPYPTRTGNKHNPIFVYRMGKKMSCQQLAYLLGFKSRERARQLCSAKTPMEKHVKALAKLENLSCEKFKQKYSFQED